MRSLRKFYDITAIMSECAYNTDTRFGKAVDFALEIESITDKKIISNITMAEPIGPQDLFDIMVIAPCTGNTIAKIANAITDSSVTMAAKAHLRNNKPLVLLVSSNDALGAGAMNIGKLLGMRNIYFVPMRQDDPINKPRSIVSDFALIGNTLEEAINGRQLNPIIYG